MLCDHVIRQALQRFLLTATGMDLEVAEPHKRRRYPAHDRTLLRPVADRVPVLGVELAFAALAEGALTTDDLLSRRTRCALVDGWSEAAHPAAAALLDRFTSASSDSAAQAS